MINLALISIYSPFLVVMAKKTTTFLPTSDESGSQFKMILALIIAVVLIITILVIVIIILFALSGRGRKKSDHKLPKRSKHRTSERKDSNNLLFVAKGQSINEKAKDIEGSGSFIFSGHSTDKPIPIEETYANSVKNTDASDSGILQQRPTDLNVKQKQVPKSQSVVIKDKSKPKV